MNPVVHFEMPSENQQRVADFYTKVFGWQTHMMGEEMGNYVLAMTAQSDENGRPKEPGSINGGFFPKDAGVPAQPSVVIAVEDIKQHMKKVEDAGGKVHGEPMEIPKVGLFVSFADSEGNKVGMLQPFSR